ncbi:response regulator [bacterium]|nr:response regulator [bacterium]
MVPTLPTAANITVDYLFKPFDEQTLLFRLEKHCKPVLGTILILDTANIISAPARHMIEAAGYSVAILDSDKQWETALNELQPELAIIDTSIPPLNREAVLQTLAKHPQLKTLAVIDSRLNPVQVGTYMRQFTDFVTHPINIYELKFRIQRLSNQELPTAPTVKNTIVAAPSRITAPPPNPPRDRDERSLLSKVYVTLHHEMRSPLTGILIGAQALSKRVATEEKPVVSEIIESAKRIRETLDTLAVSNRIRSEEYVNGTQMAKFETPTTPTFHWI